MMQRFPALLAVSWLALAPTTGAAQIELEFTQVADLSPVSDIRHAGDGSGRLFLSTLFGSIHVLKDGALLPTPFLDLAGKISTGGERGLLSFAFAPDYASSGLFYVFYTDTNGDTVIARYQASGNPDVADAASEELILQVDQPLENHNGGRLQFGPDGYLYLGFGDGGGAFDTTENAQDLSTLLGALIRIDVNPATPPYAIPPGNPFVGQPGARDEIWAYGLRNPWRISFDSATGDLYIADVGQQEFEEVNVQAADSTGGENYGWPIMEGFQCARLPNCNRTGLTLPATEYTHAQGNCSITGGEVYRGDQHPGMFGTYFYGDFCSGRIWGLARDGAGWAGGVLTDTTFQIISFGQDEAGEIYLSAQGDGVYRLSDAGDGTSLVINAGLNDAWFNPATPGQGFFFNVFPDLGLVFFAWFTYDTDRPAQDVVAVLGEPGHRWLTAIGPFAANTVTLDVELTEGGIFDMVPPEPDQTPAYGTITVAFHDCSNGTLSYEFPSLGLSGEIPIERIVQDNVALCEALGG